MVEEMPGIPLIRSSTCKVSFAFRGNASGNTVIECYPCFPSPPPTSFRSASAPFRKIGRVSPPFSLDDAHPPLPPPISLVIFRLYRADRTRQPRYTLRFRVSHSFLSCFYREPWTNRFKFFVEFSSKKSVYICIYIFLTINFWWTKFEY